ncbi:hypothetical protein EYR40_002746 [Pleurotus pulmonarius]|nr:hypothetical protein EYR40_002746 [Pleurotus pulmonarius]KAF4582403.1 hypothetical protein EYR38_002523 [Pleurotus pulmonarius]
MANLYTQATPPVDHQQPPAFHQAPQYGAPSPFQPPPPGAFVGPTASFGQPGFSQYQNPSGQYTSPPAPIQQQPQYVQQLQQPAMQQPGHPQQYMGEKPPAQAYQPQATPGMMVAPGGGGNRNAKNLPMDADGREWSNGLCDCCSDAGTSLTPLRQQVSLHGAALASSTLKTSNATSILPSKVSQTQSEADRAVMAIASSTAVSQPASVSDGSSRLEAAAISATGTLSRAEVVEIA